MNDEPSVTPSSRSLRTKAYAMAFSPRVPFEVRSRLLFWKRRRSWPTRHPVTFNQKLIWKMAKDRRPLLSTFADKVAVRDYVADNVGPELLTRLHAVVSDPSQLDPAQLPAAFVVKPNHASGMIWLVSDTSPPPGLTSGDAGRLSAEMFTTTREALAWDQLRATCRKWLATRYADAELEWAYRNIAPRIMVEELLLDADGQIPVDYKFYVFNGRVRLLEVHTDRFDDRRADLVRPDWTVVDCVLPCPPSKNGPPRPGSLDRMIRIAETLGRDTDFVRVDLFDIDGRVVFGELTNYPGGIWGPFSPPFSPESFDIELGGYWSVPLSYDELKVQSAQRRPPAPGGPTPVRGGPLRQPIGVDLG